MDKYPVLYRGSPIGEMTAEHVGPDTDFILRCTLPQDGLWCGWLVGEGGELRLGILEPQGRIALIRRRYSQRMRQPLGRLLRGEVRPLEKAGQQGQDAWAELKHPEQLFCSRWLLQELGRKQGVLWKKTAGRRYLAVPFEENAAFPLPRLFCFAGVFYIRQRRYAVFAFDEAEWPVLP